MKNKRVLMLTETALLIALATVLSMVKLVELPYGGSVTAFSMVPIMIVAFRYGTKWGMLAGFVNSLIQLLLGANNLSYATSPQAAVAIILLDYVFAFSFIGLAGVFGKLIKDKSISAVCGATMVCAIRYIFHVISGCTVWAGISIPTSAALLYSLSYNATYMIPETIINVVMAFFLFSTLNFETTTITRAKSDTKASAAVFSALSVLSIAAAIVIDSILVFTPLQNPESGELDFALASGINLPMVGIVSAVGVVLCVVFALVSRATRNN